MEKHKKIKLTSASSHGGRIHFYRWERWTAIAVIVSLLYTFLLPSGQLLTDPRFRRFEERGRPETEKYVNRANRLSEEQSWTNYVETGIAHEQALWEAEALEEIRKELGRQEQANVSKADRNANRDRYLADFQAANLRWEEEATDYINEERGGYKARLAVENFKAEIEASEDQRIQSFKDLVDAAENATAVSDSLDLALWDSIVDPGRSALENVFHDAISNTLDEIRSNQGTMSAKEQAAFETELSRLEADIRRTFELQESFYLMQGRNQYIAVRRVNDLSLRYEADAETAAAIANAVINEATEQANTESEVLLSTLESSLTNGMNNGISESILVDQWESQVQALIESGLFRWQQAEEQLYEKRIEWMNASKQSREEAEAIWKKSHEELQKQRDAWLVQVRQQVEVGRTLWEGKLQSFYDSRTNAESELAQFIQEEKSRRESSLSQLGDMVRGGGASLAQAKEAYRFFKKMAEESPTGPVGSSEWKLKQFYVEQQATMSATISKFQAMLAEAESRLDGNMNSDDVSSGLLKDRRLYAGGLRSDLSAFSESNFENDLRSELANDSQWEKYLLYRRDLNDLITNNATFTERTIELQETSFDPNSNTTIDELRRSVNLLDSRFDEQRTELLRIIDRPRGSMDDATLLSLIRQEIAEWFNLSIDRNARLKSRVLSYFDDAYAGYYLSENDNDPYLMTRAEYEWELLRRERDYVAERYQRAVEVKRYADLSEQYDAALEVASITRERTDVAYARELLIETGYLLLKGDLEHGTTQQGFMDLLLVRGVDLEKMATIATGMDTEKSLLNEIANYTLSDLNEANLTNLKERITAYVEEYQVGDRHRLTVIADRLFGLLSVSPSQREGALAQVKQTANMVIGEVTLLQAEYRSADFLAEADEVFEIYQRESLEDLLNNMSNSQAALAANAVELASTRQRLDAAKVQYSQAYTDFQLLSGADSANLIEVELRLAAAALASLLNGMKEVGEAKAPTTQFEDRYSDYYVLLSSQEQAENDILYTEEMLSVLAAAESAKERQTNLDNLLPTLNLNSSDSIERAEAILSHPELFSQSGAAASYGIILQALNNLNVAKLQWQDVSDQLSIEEAKPQRDELLIAKLKSGREQINNLIDRSIEQIIDGIRGEAKVRHDLLISYLNGNEAPDLATRIAQSQADLVDEAIRIGADASTALLELLEENRGQDFVSLLNIAESRVVTAKRSINTGTSTDYTDYLDPILANRDYEITSIVRDWILANENYFAYIITEPTSTDPTTMSERWDRLIEYVQSQNDLAMHGSSLRANLPVSASDSRIVDFRENREALLNRVSNVSAASDATLRTVYLSMTEEDRDILTRYGVSSISSSQNLRTGLNRASQSLRVELATLETNFQSIYLRELTISAQRSVSNDERSLTEILRDLESTRLSLRRLKQERDLINDRGDTPSTGLLNEISRLENLELSLYSQQLARESTFKQSQAILAEVQSPGSSIAFAQQALSKLTVEQSRQLIASQLITESQQREAMSAGELTVSAMEELKTMIGLYQTDFNGAILRDNNGNGIISQEFADLGFTSSSSLNEILSGGRNSSQLEGWANSVLAYLNNPYLSSKTSVAVRAAASKIQTSLIELAAARAFIEKGWDWNKDSEDIRANAIVAESRYAKLQVKLSFFAQFESSLQQSMTEAKANEMNVVTAALAIIEKPENAYIFQLFNGYDENGIYDGVIDETMKGRVLQLSLTIDRLRHQQSDIVIYSMAENYGNYLLNSLNSYGSMGGLVVADPELYLSQMTSLNPTAIKAKVQSVPDVDFEKNIRDALNSLPPESQLYRSYLLSIIEKSPLQGTALKNQLLLTIDNYELEMLASLETLTGASFNTFRMQADLELKSDVDESVVLFIDRYMNRGENAKSELLTLFGDIETELNNALTIDSKKQLVAAEILDRLKDTVYVSMVRDILEMIENGTDIDLIEQAILSYANSLNNPTTAEVLTAKESILIRTLRAMIALGDSLDTFDSNLIPEEFRDFVLLYQYEQAEKRYADYQLLVNSTVESEREAGVLDLRGIEADFAASILIRDFAEWQTSHSVTDYLAQANGLRSIEDYLSEYLNDRHTTTELLPRGGSDIVKLVMQQEYSRLLNDGSINSIGALDERSYFTDFTDRIYIERVKDFSDQSGFTISGNVTADAQAYKNVFDAMLLQNEYSFNGLSFRERLVSTDDVNVLFNVAFAYLYQQPSIQSYDPDVVRMLRNSGELNELVTSESVLPDEWLAYRSIHPDYANLENHNYRIELKEIANQFGIPKLYEELARIEATGLAFDRVGSGYMALSLTEIADSDLDLAIDLAGYSELVGNQSLRNDIKRFLVTQSVVQSQTSLQNLMRQESLLQYHYGSESKRNSLEVFLASESEKVARIEEVFFRSIEKADGRLRELAKNNRGDFFYHLINAVDSDLILPSELNAPFDTFKQTFFDTLTENEKSSLLEHANDYRDFFAMRSSQELISSGMFEQIEAEIFGNLSGADISDGELAEARQYKSALMISFIRSVGIENPTAVDVDNYLPITIQGSLRSKAAESVARAINNIDPTFIMVLRKETVLLERFIDRYLETDVLRNELIAFLSSESDLTDFGSSAANQRNIAEQNLADAEYGLLSHVEADKRAIVSLTNNYSIEQAVASRLMSFADLRGSNVLQSRFVNYRTYADDGNNLFEAEYRKYLSTSTSDDRYLDVNFFDINDESPAINANGDEILTYHKFRQGMLLDTENALDSSNTTIQASSLKDMFADGSFITKLVSDEIKNDYDTIELDNDTVELRTVQRISYDSSVEPESQILEAYYAHLANNYLEALSNLNNSLLGLVKAASIVDGISSAKDQLEANVVAAELGDYTALRSSFQAARQAASDIKSNSGESVQIEVKSKIDGLEEALSNAKDQLGASGRRKHLKVIGQTMFVDEVFEPIAAEFEAARNAYNVLTDQALVLQNNYSEAIRRYTQHLDEMSSWWRQFESVQSEAERRLAVKNYAETPYLFSASMSEETRLEALKEYASDAREEYRRASLLLEQANAQLKETGYNIQIDINLAKFDRVVLALEDSVASQYIQLPLTIEEKNELEELRDRIYRQYNYLSVEEAREARNSAIDLDDLARLEGLENREIYEQYGTLISERADYIKHTMRMIRLQKAKALVQAEIQRLEIEVTTNEKEFEESLSLHFGDFSRITDENERNEAIEARNTVYQRLASQYESGGTNFFNEMSAWYWLSGDWLADFGTQSITQRFTTTPSQIMLAAGAVLSGNNNTSPTDRSAIGRWLSEKSGSVFSSFSGFSSLYFQMLVGVGNLDRMTLKLEIVKSIWWPVMLNASSSISDIMRRLFYQPWTAVMLPFWSLVYAEGKRQIGTAQAEYNVAQITSLITVLNLADYSNRNPGNAVGEAVTKQKAYEESKAKLEYFTKVPDLQTLKDRLQKYGELQSDPDPDLTAILYSLTEEDLRYLVELDEDNNIISLDSSGNLQSFTDEEESEVFNAKTLQSEAEYTDSFGRKYDRDQIIMPGNILYNYLERNGNSYEYIPEVKRNCPSENTCYSYTVIDPIAEPLIGNEYTRIRVADHDGTIRFGYALLNESVENKSVYNAGDILRSLVDHGNELREKRVNNYLLAGSELTDNGNDWSFILAERDNTMKDLFDESVNKNDGEGGREFAGYTMVYADYEANQKAVFDLELQQRVSVQRKEWDLREQELLARKQEWEARIEAMLKAGNRAWTDAEDRFLSEWREWEQEFDRKIEEGNQEWDQRIAEHMTDRQQWETDLKQKASEAASEAALTEVLGGFNVQLQTLAANAGISMTPINLNDAVEKAKSEIIANLPTQVEQLASINESIERFNTNVSLSEMWGTDTQSVLAGLATDFHNEMNQFQKQMVVYSNSKVMAQYQQLLNDLLEQIDRQNRAIEQQTELAAMQAGFIRSGNVYIKQSKLVSSAVGMVEAYQWFDGKAAFDDYLSSIGDGYGGALVSDQNGNVTHKSRDEIMADLPAFLETADTVQVESFFAVQKMILQNAFAKIMGTGSASERQNSRDKNVIGDLAWWIGTPAGSNNRVSSTLDQENPLKGLVDGKVQEEVANLTYKKNPTQALDVLKYLGDSGFGELGSMGNRPSGIYLGFYNKLDIVSRYVDGKDADKMSQIAGSIDPITATLNQFNPVVMLATSIQNVRVASEVYGTGSGYMVEAQLLGAVKGALPAIGAAVGSIIPVLGTTVGAAIGSAIASTIHVDAKTGKRDYQTSDQTAVAALHSMGYIGTVAEIALAGAETDSKGNFTGHWSLEGARGDALLMNIGLKAISAEIVNMVGPVNNSVAQAITSSLVSTGLNTAVEYQKMKAGQSNNYAAMATSDLSRAGELFTTMYQATKEANKTDQNQRASDVIAGAGYSRQFGDGFIGALSGYIDLGEGIWEAAKALGSNLWSGVKGLFNGEASNQSKAADVNGKTAGGSKKLSFWEKTEAGLIAVGSGLSAVGSGLSAVGSATGVSALGEGLWSGVSGLSEGLWSGVSGLGKGLWSGLGALGDGFQLSENGFDLKALGSGLVGLGKGLWSGVSALGVGLGEGFWSGVSGLGKGLWSGLSGLVGGVGLGLGTISDYTGLSAIGSSISESETFLGTLKSLGLFKEFVKNQESKLENQKIEAEKIANEMRDERTRRSIEVAEAYKDPYKTAELMEKHSAVIRDIHPDWSEEQVLRHAYFEIKELSETLLANVAADYVYLTGRDHKNNPALQKDKESLEKVLAAFGAHHISDDKINQLGIKTEMLRTKSGMEAALFRIGDEGSNEYVLAYRGTEVGGGVGFGDSLSSTLQDVWADLVNGLGISNQQYRDAADLAIEVQEKLGGGAQLSFTGHSLGGGLASTAAAVTNLKAKTFNAASTDAETIRLHGGSTDGIENRVTAYYVGDDILSNIQDHAITKIITLVPNTLLRTAGNLLNDKVSIMPGWMPSAVGKRSMIAPGGSHSNLTVMAALQNRILNPGYYAELK